VNIYEDIIVKDCIMRHRIRVEKTFRELAITLISNFSAEFTFSRLKNITRTRDIHTVKNYTRYLSEAYLTFILERFSPKLKMQIIAQRRFRAGKFESRMFENLVAVELHRRYASKTM